MISAPWISKCDKPSFCPFRDSLYFRHCIILFYFTFTFSIYHYPVCNNTKSRLVCFSPGFWSDCLVHSCRVEGTEKVTAMTASGLCHWMLNCLLSSALPQNTARPWWKLAFNKPQTFFAWLKALQILQIFSSVRILSSPWLSEKLPFEHAAPVIPASPHPDCRCDSQQHSWRMFLGGGKVTPNSLF